MGDHSPPSIGIPFPRQFLSDRSSPFDASDKSVPSSPITQTVSLRWMASPTNRNGTDSPVRLRVPSLASATTTTSTLQSPQDPWFSHGGGGPSEYEATSALSQVHAAHAAPAQRRSSRSEKRRSVLQLFNSTISKIHPTYSPPQAAPSPTSPVAHDFPTHLSTSKPSFRGFSPGTSRERGEADSFGGEGLCSDSACGPFHTDETLTIEKRREPASQTTRLRKQSRPAHSEGELAPFNADLDLTLQDLQHAQTLEVYDQNGKSVKFGGLWQDQRTCVIFIRHFWCPSCADYTQSIAEQADPQALRKAGVKLVVISNGSPAMIKSYQRIFKLPFSLYTDPSLRVYRALGMNLRTINGGPQRERGDYIEHGLASGLAMVVKNAVKGRMPIHKNGGDIKQLGGEFVLGPGLRCSYISRMHNTRSHAPIREVLSAAGVDMDTHLTFNAAQPRLSTATDEEERWMQERDAEMRKIRARKGMRRGFAYEHRSSSDSDLLES